MVLLEWMNEWILLFFFDIDFIDNQTDRINNKAQTSFQAVSFIVQQVHFFVKFINRSKKSHLMTEDRRESFNIMIHNWLPFFIALFLFEFLVRIKLNIIFPIYCRYLFVRIKRWHLHLNVIKTILWSRI
jgi:hypothetical protein